MTKKINYEELEGKICDVTSEQALACGIKKIKVAAIDPEVGITLVDADKPERRVACLKMFGIKGAEGPVGYSERVFAAIVKAIQRGVFDDAHDEEINSLRLKYDLESDGLPDDGQGSLPESDCAFA
jgi:hypothetical protein